MDDDIILEYGDEDNGGIINVPNLNSISLQIINHVNNTTTTVLDCGDEDKGMEV